LQEETEKVQEVFEKVQQVFKNVQQVFVNLLEKRRKPAGDFWKRAAGFCKPAGEI